MALKQLKLKTERYTERVNDALNSTFTQAATERYEFITPELLLLSITQQKEFGEFAATSGIDLDAMSKQLARYVEQIDRMPEDEDYEGILSMEFVHLIELLNNHWERCNKDTSILVWPETVPSVLFQILQLDDTFAKFMVEKYIGEEPKNWYDEILNAYQEDIEKFGENATMKHKPAVRTEAYINGKKIDLENMSQDEILSKMMASAGRLVGALKNLGKMQKGIQSSETPEEEYDGELPFGEQREPWEDLVTCVNDIYAKKNPLIGRNAELERTIRVLCRKDKNNPLFIGEPGVGKTALIYGLARMIEEGNVPQWLKDQRIYMLDLTAIIAGTSYHGEFEKRMKEILDGARKRGNSIIYIDEIHSIMGSNGGNGSLNAGDILKPYLEDGAVRFIGSTTYQDFNKQMANNKAIVRRFQQIDIKEPSVEETLEIIRGLLQNYEKHHHVKYAEDAIRYAVEQSDNLIHDRFLPDKAIDIIDEAGAYLQQNPLLDKNGNPKQARYQKISVDIIKHILTDVCRIDAKALTSDSNADLKALDKRIAAEIYGQDTAIQQVVRSVMMSKAGLMEPNKPIASLLFVGPTGVGKTEVCKVLAQKLGIELIRFDMSEYTEKHTISKLIGSPAGYVGYDEGGLLTDAIRKTPNCVLLLDEIEKAHSDIYNILLQVMDYAKLTDNKGNKADFRNVILVMTSNAGAQFAGQAAIGFGGGQSKGQAMLSSVKKTFKPEFLNRLSGTVVFNDMDEHMASLILDKKLRQLSSRLESKKVTMSLTAEARQFLLTKGFNAQYGAREMDRVIQQHLTPLLMEEILFGKLKKGGNVTIELNGDTLCLPTSIKR